MATEAQQVVLTYNGIDGACAAAAVLLRHPDSLVEITSAARIAQTLRSVSEEMAPGCCVHVCGLGVACSWEELEGALARLVENGSRAVWYCGRGYLDDLADRLPTRCTPVLERAETNTGAVCQALQVSQDPRADMLLSLARQDPNIGLDAADPTHEEAFWIDLINASVAQYFKYQDENTYADAIRNLAAGVRTQEHEKLVTVFRRAGYRYVLWGKSTTMQDLRRNIAAFGAVDEPVLITGESGVGKEYVAHLLHERSERAMGPFVAVNCALFAGNVGLANSVLFGHVEGAFTGAAKERSGAFVSADSGILFLDELADLPAEVQAKLLRVVEDGWLTPEGSDTPRKVDVRILAATNAELPDRVRAGRFRADLFHRLDVLHLQVPPLRRHAEDIPAIIERFRDATGIGLPEGKSTKADMDRLAGFDWPGNVRQLIKVLKRVHYLGRPLSLVLDEERALSNGKESEGGWWPGAPDEIRPIRQVQSEYARRALALNKGNYTATAKQLGIAANTLRSYVSRSE